MLRVSEWKLTELVSNLMPQRLWLLFQAQGESPDYEKYSEIKIIKIGLISPKPSNAQLLACQKGLETLISAGQEERRDELGRAYFAIIRYTGKKATPEHLENFAHVFVNLTNSNGLDNTGQLTRFYIARINEGMSVKKAAQQAVLNHWRHNNGSTH